VVLLATDGKTTRGWGVKTGAAAICFWQVDASGVTLWLDVRNGGEGVRLGERQLEVATVIAFDGGEGVPVFQAAQAFCRALCDRPRLPRAPVYGWNNWYYTYGKGFSSADILRDSELVRRWHPRAPPTARSC